MYEEKVRKKCEFKSKKKKRNCQGVWQASYCKNEKKYNGLYQNQRYGATMESDGKIYIIFNAERKI